LWLIVAVASLALPCAGTDRTWTGNGGADNNWMTPANWQGSVAPSPGDNLIFNGISNAGNSTNHNNFPAGTVFGKISINTASGQDFSLGGNRVVLTNGISETAGGIGIMALAGIVDFDITFGTNLTFTASHLLILNGTLDFQIEHKLFLNDSGSVTINGTLLSAGGGEVDVAKSNSGTLTISSTATVSTNRLYVDLQQGSLHMAGVASRSLFGVESNTSMVLDGVAEEIEITHAGLLSGIGTASYITFDPTATAICSPGDNGTPGVLSCTNFSYDEFNSSSSLQINVSGTAPGTGYSQLLVYGTYNLCPPVHSLGASTVNLGIQWNYTPQTGDSFLVLKQSPSQSYVVSKEGFFTGLPPNSIYDATNGSSLAVVYDSTGVTLSAIRTSSSRFLLWKASALDLSTYGSRNWSSTNNWAQNSAPTNGSAVVFSPYQMTCYTTNFDYIPVPPVTNDLAGASLSALSFTGSNYMLYGNSVTMSGGLTNSSAGGTNACYLDIAAAAPLPLDVEPGGSLLLGGGFAGSGTISKEGAGTVVYVGTTMNAYLGTVVVDNGTLQVDGSFTDGSFTVNGGVLDGTGTVSDVTMNGGTLKPGDSPGILHMEGDLAMAPGSAFEAELNGPIPGTDYSQLQVIGGVNLNGATLNLQPNYAATVGTAFLILANDGSDPIVGAFAGLPEGAIFQAGGQYFSISYKAGSGHNDVVVTRINPPATFTHIQFLPPADLRLQGSGATNVTYSIFANTNLTTTNWLNIGTVPADGSGVFLFDDSNALSFPQRFYEVR